MVITKEFSCSYNIGLRSVITTSITIRDTTNQVTDPSSNDDNVYDQYEYSGYHRFTPEEYIQTGEASPYSKTSTDKGLIITRQHFQRLEILIRTTGERVDLWKRKWSGQECPHFDDRRGRDKARCTVCLLPGSLIWMSDYTYVPIESINKGQSVFSHTSLGREVTDTFKREVSEDIYSIKVWGDSTTVLKLTRDHPVYILRVPRSSEGCVLWNKVNKSSFNFVNAEDLQLNDYLCFPITNNVSDEISPKEANLLGYYVAEGCCLFLRQTKFNQDSKDVSFAFNKNENLYVEDVKNLVKHCFKVKGWSFYEIPNTEGVDLRFYSKELATFLLNHVSTENRMRNLHKRLSPAIMSMSYECLLQFVAGWSNGDGTFSTYKDWKRGHLRIDSSSFILMKQLQTLLLKNHVYCNLGKRKNNGGPNNKTQSGTIYYVSISDYKFLRDLAALCPKIKLNYLSKGINNNRIKFFENCALLPIKSIELVHYTGAVYNIEVETDNSYCVNNYAVHNCFGTGIVGGFDLYKNPFAEEGYIQKPPEHGMINPPPPDSNKYNREYPYLSRTSEMYPPWQIFIRIFPETDDKTLLPRGIQQRAEPQAWTLPIPMLQDRDIITRYDENGNEMWRYEVLDVTRNEGFFKGSVMNYTNISMFVQTFRLFRLDRTDIKYQLRPPSEGYGYGGILPTEVEEVVDQVAYSIGYNDATASRGFNPSSAGETRALRRSYARGFSDGNQVKGEGVDV